VRFRDSLRWIDSRLQEATLEKDKAYLTTLHGYTAQSLRRLAAARKVRELDRLQKRLEKLDLAAVLYVQNALGHRRID
jgi:hypothetical protein